MWTQRRQRVSLLADVICHCSGTFFVFLGIDWKDSWRAAYLSSFKQVYSCRKVLSFAFSCLIMFHLQTACFLREIPVIPPWSFVGFLYVLSNVWSIRTPLSLRLVCGNKTTFYKWFIHGRALWMADKWRSQSLSRSYLIRSLRTGATSLINVFQYRTVELFSQSCCLNWSNFIFRWVI